MHLVHILPDVQVYYSYQADIYKVKVEMSQMICSLNYIYMSEICSRTMSHTCELILHSEKTMVFGVSFM